MLVDDPFGRRVVGNGDLKCCSILVHKKFVRLAAFVLFLCCDKGNIGMLIIGNCKLLDGMFGCIEVLCFEGLQVYSYHFVWHGVSGINHLWSFLRKSIVLYMFKDCFPLGSSQSKYFLLAFLLFISHCFILFRTLEVYHRIHHR